MLWAVVLGVGTVTFPLILTLIGLRARTPGHRGLSGFTQSIGYLIAAIGPFGFGLLHDATGGWTVPLLVLTALSLPLFLVAAVRLPAGYVEDQLPTRHNRGQARLTPYLSLARIQVGAGEPGMTTPPWTPPGGPPGEPGHAPPQHPPTLNVRRLPSSASRPIRADRTPTASRRRKRWRAGRSGCRSSAAPRSR